MNWSPQDLILASSEVERRAVTTALQDHPVTKKLLELGFTAPHAEDMARKKFAFIMEKDNREYVVAAVQVLDAVGRPARNDCEKFLDVAALSYGAATTVISALPALHLVPDLRPDQQVLLAVSLGASALLSVVPLSIRVWCRKRSWKSEWTAVIRLVIIVFASTLQIVSLLLRDGGTPPGSPSNSSEPARD